MTREYLTYEDEVDFWLGEEAEVADPNEFLLVHLDDQRIHGLGDSYDDGRIDTLAFAYTQLRKMYLLRIYND